MNAIARLVSVAALAGAGCDAAPGVSAGDLRVIAPTPASRNAAGYLSISNDRDEVLVISALASPQFEQVELHETRVENGIARMRKLGDVTVGPRQTLEFEEGGKHLMLIGPVDALAVGMPVTVEIGYDAGVLNVTAPLEFRAAPQ